MRRIKTMSDKIIKGAVISDIHLGALCSNSQWENLEENFFKPILEDLPDVILVAGDTTDERVNANSNVISVLNRFVDKLIGLGVAVIVIEGTKSHDDNQMKVFSHRVNDNFRMYDKVTIDNVLGMNMLMIPEEYMHDPEEYYKDYLNGDHKYDLVLCHGMWEHVAYTGARKSLFRKLTSPTWSYEKHFEGLVHGVIYSGHIHTRSSHKKYRSIGSFGRTSMGEEENKGFIRFEYNLTKRKMESEKHIVNTGAKVFKTLLESKLPEDNDELIKVLTKWQGKCYKLRIQLDKEVTSERKSDLVGFVSNYVNCNLDDKYTRKLRKKNQKEIIATGTELLENKYQSMTMEQATAEWCKEKFSKVFNEKRINEILNSD